MALSSLRRRISIGDQIKLTVTGALFLAVDLDDFEGHRIVTGSKKDAHGTVTEITAPEKDWLKIG